MKKTQSAWLVALVSVFAVAGSTFAKTASCPCNPCPCSPCTCGGGGSKGNKEGGSSKHHDDLAKHHDRDRAHGHHDGGGGVGVGMNVDLSVIGKKDKEPNPFPTGSGGEPVAHTQEKHKPTTSETPTANLFRDVHVTGPQAKADASPGPLNVDNDKTPEGEKSEPEEHEETVHNPDGSDTTTRQFDDGHGNVTNSSTTQYQDGTKHEVTKVKFKDGNTHEQTTERDGSSTTHIVSDDGVTKTDKTTVIDKSTGNTTENTITIEKDGTKTTKFQTTDKDGHRTRTVDIENSDGSKESSKSNPDGSGSWTRTDKNGKTIKVVRDGNGKVSTDKGTFTTEDVKNHMILVKYDLPDGTGGSVTYPEGTKVEVNTDDDKDPLPFKATPPPKQ